MIKRLIELNLQGFRLFRDLVKVALDADVVLIYGPNGSGKSSLIQAIEFAITGKVSSLESFTEDYPACLKNGAADRCQASILCRTGKGELTQEFSFEQDGRPDLSQSVIRAADRQLFSERCLLSQVTLGRLFEHYQSKNSSGEQPLVAFIRELLKLERLDQLTEGLEIVSRDPTTKKQIPLYAQLDDDISLAKSNFDALCDELEKLPSIQQMLASADENVAVQLADRLPLKLSLQPDAESYAEFLKRVDQLKSESNDQLSTIVKRRDAIRNAITKAEKPLAVLKSAASLPELATLKIELAKLSAPVSEVKPKVLNWLDKVRHAIKDLPQVETDETAMALLAATRDCLTTESYSRSQNEDRSVRDDGQPRVVSESPEAARRAAFLLTRQRDLFLKWRDDRLYMLRGLTEKSAKLSRRKAANETELADAEKALQESNAAEASASVARRWAETLAAVLQKMEADSQPRDVDNDQCPVCERDFSELRQGLLSERLKREIKLLNADLTELELAARRKGETQTRHADLKVEKQRLADDLLDTDGQLTESKWFQQGLASLDKEFTYAQPVIERVIELLNQEEVLRTRLAEFELQQQRQLQARQELTSLCTTLNLKVPDSATGPTELVSGVEDQIEELLQSFGGQLSTCQAVVDFLQNVSGSWEHRKALVEKRELNRQKLARLEQATQSIGGEIKRLRKLRDLANSVKKDVVEEVFNESLNNLWGQLFGRLVKSEPFRLSLSELRIAARKLKVDFEAISEGDRFEQPGAVLSSGNLNTAALSLFLTLNLIEQARHDVLVLDDPVQNMDDMHVVHLAEVLRSIARETGRQIVVAVHERPLFEYLALELAPAHPDHSLITVELDRNSHSFLSTINSKRHEWQADNLAFG